MNAEAFAKKLKVNGESRMSEGWEKPASAWYVTGPCGDMRPVMSGDARQTGTNQGSPAAGF